MTALFHLPFLLAQATDPDTQMPDMQGGNNLGPGGAAALGVGLIIYFAVIILMIVGMWKIFTKAGEPGWASLIPIYNFYVLCKIARKPNWWLVFIPFVNFVYYIIVVIALAEQFGKGTGFALGLIFLPFIFYPMLGFGSAQYRGTPPLPAGSVLA